MRNPDKNAAGVRAKAISDRRRRLSEGDEESHSGASVSLSRIRSDSTQNTRLKPPMGSPHRAVQTAPLFAVVADHFDDSAAQVEEGGAQVAAAHTAEHLLFADGFGGVQREI